MAGNTPGRADACVTMPGPPDQEATMPEPYTHTQLDDVEDSAPKFGIEGYQARFPTKEVGAEQTGFSHFRYEPGVRQAFGHRHDEAEELYLVLSGSGRVKLDDDVLALAPRDVVRVSPAVTRCFEAG